MLRNLLIFLITVCLISCGSDNGTNPPPELIPVLGVNASELDFGTNLTNLTFNISNTGDDTLSWQIAHDSTWLTCSSDNGTATSGQVEITVTVDRTGKSSGTYYDTLDVTSNGGTKAIEVRMTVPAPPTTLALPDMTVADGAVVTVPLTVQGFTNVAGIELHIQYDNQEMDFDSVTSTNIAGFYADSSSSTVHLTWANISTPLNLSEGDTLLTLNFSGLTDTSPLQFIGNTEIVDNLGDPITIILEDGSITLEP